MGSCLSRGVGMAWAGHPAGEHRLKRSRSHSTLHRAKSSQQLHEDARSGAKVLLHGSRTHTSIMRTESLIRANSFESDHADQPLPVATLLDAPDMRLSNATDAVRSTCTACASTRCTPDSFEPPYFMIDTHDPLSALEASSARLPQHAASLPTLLTSLPGATASNGMHSSALARSGTHPMTAHRAWLQLHAADSLRVAPCSGPMQPSCGVASHSSTAGRMDAPRSAGALLQELQQQQQQEPQQLPPQPQPSSSKWHEHSAVTLDPALQLSLCNWSASSSMLAPEVTLGLEGLDVALNLRACKPKDTPLGPLGLVAEDQGLQAVGQAAPLGPLSLVAEDPGSLLAAGEAALSPPTSPRIHGLITCGDMVELSDCMVTEALRDSAASTRSAQHVSLACAAATPPTSPTLASRGAEAGLAPKRSSSLLAHRVSLLSSLSALFTPKAAASKLPAPQPDVAQQGKPRQTRKPPGREWRSPLNSRAQQASPQQPQAEDGWEMLSTIVKAQAARGNSAPLPKLVSHTWLAGGRGGFQCKRPAPLVRMGSAARVTGPNSAQTMGSLPDRSSAHVTTSLGMPSCSPGLWTSPSSELLSAGTAVWATRRGSPPTSAAGRLPSGLEEGAASGTRLGSSSGGRQSAGAATAQRAPGAQSEGGLLSQLRRTASVLPGGSSKVQAAGLRGGLLLEDAMAAGLMRERTSEPAAARVTAEGLMASSSTRAGRSDDAEALALSYFRPARKQQLQQQWRRAHLAAATARPGDVAGYGALPHQLALPAVAVGPLASLSTTELETPQSSFGRWQGMPAGAGSTLLLTTGDMGCEGRTEAREGGIDSSVLMRSQPVGSCLLDGSADPSFTCKRAA